MAKAEKGAKTGVKKQQNKSGITGTTKTIIPDDVELMSTSVSEEKAKEAEVDNVNEEVKQVPTEELAAAEEKNPEPEVGEKVAPPKEAVQAKTTLPSKQLTVNFNLNEFHSKDGQEVPHKYYKNVTELARNLQELRNNIGRPVIVSGSGYRSPEHNKAVGGVPHSQHLTASAADISVKGMTPKELAKKIEHLIEEGKMVNGGIGIYPTFVHYDIRSRRARW